MIIYFVELERPDRAFFREALAEHDLRFADTPDEVAVDAEALCVFINFEIDATFLATHPALRYITTRSGSVEHIDLAACRARGIAVSWVRGFGDDTVAEHTFALLLALSRKLREIRALTQLPHPPRFSYGAARGIELAGKTLGIIGLGPIGERVLRLAKAFQMEVLAFDPLEMPPGLPAALGFRWCSLDELLAASHVISLHVRLSPATRHLLNRETLARCRPGVLIVNTARGALIDTDALADALESGQVGGAGLDVLEEEQVLRAPASRIISEQIVEHLRSELLPPELPAGERLRDLQEIVQSDAMLTRPNVVFTPHIAFNSVEAMERLHAGTLANLRAFLAGTPISLVGDA